jgi:hypothetical protein
MSGCGFIFHNYQQIRKKELKSGESTEFSCFWPTTYFPTGNCMKNDCINPFSLCRDIFLSF